MKKREENSETLLKEYERLKRENERLRYLLQVGILLNSTLDPQKIIEDIMENAKLVVGAEVSSLLLLDEETNELVFQVAQGKRADEVKAIRLKLGQGIAGTVALTGESVIVNDAWNDPRLFKGVDQKTDFRTRNLMAVPLKDKGKVIGVAEAINKLGGNDFTDQDLVLFESFANFATTAIINARLYEKINLLFYDTILALSSAIDAKDEYTRGHSERVTVYSIEIAKEMGLEKDKIKELQIAALLHDVGKIGIPERVLLKNDRLTEEEFAIMKKHPEIGKDILAHIKLLRNSLPGILEHHERPDGKGYPLGLKGKEISLYGRIIAVADTYDAMTSDRPYRKGLPDEVAISEIQKNAGKQFDEEVVKAFISAYKKGKIKRQSNFKTINIREVLIF